MIRWQEFKTHIEITAGGKLTLADYHAMMPTLNRVMREHDRPSFLVILDDFEGWYELRAFWLDIRIGFKYLDELGPIALIGENKLEKWVMSIASKLFSAPMKYFEKGQEQEALSWIKNQDMRLRYENVG
jgi:hypothetical protein